MKPFGLWLGLSLVTAVVMPAYALETSTREIVLGSNLKIAFLPYAHGASDTTELLVIATPDLDERQRQIMGLDQEPVRTISFFSLSGSDWIMRLQKELDPAMDLVDTMRISGGADELAGYQNSQLMILRQTSGEFEPGLSAGSMYVGVNWESSPEIDMFTDLNGDGLDDFLMPDFHGWQVALQSVDGFRSPQLLGPGPQMTFGDSTQFVGYRAQTPYLFDENLDGLDDLAFWSNGRFEVFLQQQDGFAQQPLVVDPDQRDVIDNFMSVTLEEGEDSEQTQRVLDAVGDIDGDGLADMIIQAMQGDGIFGLETRYEVHRGLATIDNRLIFEPLASSIVSSGGIQLNNERLDLSGDGKEEFVVTSVKITLGTIIGALITRSASVDVSIYHMEGDVFPEQPSLTKDIKVRFDFSTGDLFVPAVLSADVTGDGRKDLLVQKDLDTLLVYPGEPTQTLFAKSAIKLELELPSDREGFLVVDLNKDGRDELVLHLQREKESLLSVVQFSD